MNISKILTKLGIDHENFGTSTGMNWTNGGGKKIESFSPVDGKVIATTEETNIDNFQKVLDTAQAGFEQWRLVPAPKRGEVVRQFAEALRENKADLGALVSYEMGKSLQEGMGEVQEMIDICDFAVGLSRQLYGFTMHSERPEHRMYDQYHPLGVVGIISAFNFPVAVWSWNAALAWVCGDSCIWKPSPKTPLTAIACQKIIATVFKQNNVPEGVSCLVSGHECAETLTNSPEIPLVSFTGSTRVGKIVAQAVAARLGRSILELGGNNAIIVSEYADLNKVLVGTVFGAVGTAGQRCTTTRRLIVHESVYDKTIEVLKKAYAQIKIGNPLNEANHVGPLIDQQAVENYTKAIGKAMQEGGKILVDGGVLSGEGFESGCYVKPCIIEARPGYEIVCEETFAPILYILKYSGSVENAIAIQNNVPQGLSSALFTSDLRETQLYLSAVGSDCGIANINIGTSGAEIGGAFGGEKETGGGRESGSDAWKAYMRRQTNTINYGTSLPLAQGIHFDI